MKLFLNFFSFEKREKKLQILSRNLEYRRKKF